MRRQVLIVLLASVIGWPFAAKAQEPLPWVAFLTSASPGPSSQLLAAFHTGLEDGGFVEGQNLKVEYRWAEGQYDRLPALAAELVSMRVGVIHTMGDGAYAANAAQPSADRNAIPIVFSLGDDPVAVGLVASLNRPGG